MPEKAHLPCLSHCLTSITYNQVQILKIMDSHYSYSTSEVFSNLGSVNPANKTVSKGNFKYVK